MAVWICGDPNGTNEDLHCAKAGIHEAHPKKRGTQMKQYIVDAFTDKVFSGNPAAVCILDGWISDKQSV